MQSLGTGRVLRKTRNCIAKRPFNEAQGVRCDSICNAFHKLVKVHLHLATKHYEGTKVCEDK